MLFGGVLYNRFVYNSSSYISIRLGAAFYLAIVGVVCAIIVAAMVRLITVVTFVAGGTVDTRGNNVAVVNANPVFAASAVATDPTIPPQQPAMAWQAGKQAHTHLARMPAPYSACCCGASDWH